MATKLLPDPDETDQLIIETIRHIQKSKNRAFSKLTSLLAMQKLKMFQQRMVWNP